uniref:ZZ-type domain-containing protein n=1 Tax=Mycena chlorophos TaxID=658473 RepID=A0ABQ0KW29_MYCCL|nr:predicted protein [Mycena chlorophos]
MDPHKCCFWCPKLLSAAEIGPFHPQDAIYACTDCVNHQPELARPELHRAETFAALFSLQPGSVILLPAIERHRRVPTTLWHPAEIIEFNPNRLPELVLRWLTPTGARRGSEFYHSDRAWLRYPLHLDPEQVRHSDEIRQETKYHLPASSSPPSGNAQSRGH